MLYRADANYFLEQVFIVFCFQYRRLYTHEQPYLPSESYASILLCVCLAIDGTVDIRTYVRMHNYYAMLIHIACLGIKHTYILTRYVRMYSM